MFVKQGLDAFGVILSEWGKLNTANINSPAVSWSGYQEWASHLEPTGNRTCDSDVTSEHFNHSSTSANDANAAEMLDQPYTLSSFYILSIFSLLMI